MRDLFNNLKIDDLTLAQVITADEASTAADLQGFEAALLMAIIGNSGDTLSGSVYISLEIQHGDVADGSDAAACVQADVIGVTLAAAGQFALIDAPAEDSQTFKVGYVGTKRYVRVNINVTGTHTVGFPAAVIIAKGNANSLPVD